MPDTTRKTITDLLAVMAALRTPGTGCPWDLEQTFRTVAPYTLEEAYEVVDAIARDDRADLQEELGDLLLQVVFHSQLAAEEGAFDFAAVVDGITAKMIRRHPHVFGDADGRTTELATGWWEEIKAGEKAAKAARRTAAGVASTTARTESSVLDDVPIAMAALTRAVKLQDKAAKVGFDWPSRAPVLDKLREELAELQAALDASADTSAPDTSAPDTSAPDAAIEEEFGDLLFVMTNLARHLELDPEAALRQANAKFTRRFGYIEARLAERGRTPSQSSLEEMDAIWNEIRAADKI